MTLPEIAEAIRRTNPQVATFSDDQIVRLVGDELSKAGRLGEFPVIERALRIADAEIESYGRGNIGNFGDALQRGWARGSQGLNVLQGATDPTNAADIARYQKTVDANPISPEFREFMEADGFADSAKAFMRAPVRIISEVIGESLGQSIPSAIGGFAGGAAGGSFGGPAGSAVGATLGAAAGAGAGSYITEYSAGILESMQEAGMDISNPDSIRSFFSNPELVAEARSKATAKSIPIAAFDGASMGLAGKFVRGLGKAATMGQIAKASGKELGMQSGFGMSGETLGQIAAGEDLDGKSIFLEGIAEVGSAPGEIASNFANTRRQATPRQAEVPAPAVQPSLDAIRNRLAQQRASLSVEIPAPRLAPVSAGVPVAPLAASPAINPTVAQPTEVAPILAGAETQAMLVQILGMDPVQAATIPETEAQTLIEQEVARQEADRIDAEASMQAAAREQEVAERAAAFREAEARRRQLLQGTRREGDQLTMPGIREAAAVTGQPVIRPVDATPDRPVLSPVSKGQTTMRFTPPRAVKQQPAFAPGQVLSGGEQAQSAAASVPDLARPVPRTQPVTPPVAAHSPQFATPPPVATPPPAPAPTRAPIPLIRAVSRSLIPSNQAAFDTSKTDRWLVGRNKETGQIEARKVSTTGRVANRANPKATIYTVLAALREKGFKVGHGSVNNAMRGKPVGESSKNPKAAKAADILAEAEAQGYGPGEAMVPLTSLSDTFEQLDILIAPKDTEAPALFRMSPEEYAAFKEESIQAGQAVGRYDDTAGTSQAVRVREADAEVLERTADPTALDPATALEQSEDIVTPPPTVQEPARMETPAPLPETQPTQSAQQSAQQTAPAASLAERFSPEQLKRFHSTLLKQGVKALNDDGVIDFATAFTQTIPKEQLPAWRRATPDQLVEVLRGAAQRLLKSEAVQKRTPPVVSNETVEVSFETALRLANSFGITVILSDATREIKAGGEYTHGNRTIKLALANVAAPSRQDLITLLHEVAHDITENAPPGAREALQRSARDILNPDADPRTRPGGGTELTPQERANEIVVENMALENIDRQVAEGLAAQLWRATIDVLTRASMYFQKLFLGEENVGGSLAATWAQNQMDAFLAGDKLVPFLNQFGRKPSLHTMAGFFSPRTIHIKSDGSVTYPFSNDTTPEAAAYNVLVAGESYKQSSLQRQAPQAARDADEFQNELPAEILDAAKENATAAASLAIQSKVSAAKVDHAVANTLIPVLRGLYDRALAMYPKLTDAEKRRNRELGIPTAETLTFENFLADHGRGFDMEAFRAKSAEALISQLQLETGATEVSLPFDSNIQVDNLAGSEQAAAEIKLIETVNRFNTAIGRRMLSTEREITRLSAKEERRRATIQAVNQNLTDFKTTDSAARSLVREYLRDLRKISVRAQKTDTALGDAQATFDALLSETERAQVANKNLDRLLAKVDLDKVSMGAALQALYQIEDATGIQLAEAAPLEIRTAVINEVTLNPDSPLKDFLKIGSGENANIRGTALFSAVLTFVKQQGHLAEIVRSQMSRSQEDTKALLDLRKVLNETNERTLDDLKKTVQSDLKPRSNRLIYKMLLERERALREQGLLARYQRQNDLLKTSGEVVATLTARAQQRRQVFSEFTLAPNVPIPNPESPEQSGAEVFANMKPLSMAPSQFVKSSEMQTILRNLKAWLDVRAENPDAQDAYYLSARIAYERLKEAQLSDESYRILAGVKSGWHEGVSEVLLRSGTRAGRLAANMWLKADRIRRTYANRDSDEGKRWERPFSKFIHTSGLAPGNVRDLFRDPALFFMNNARGISEAEAFVQLEAQFRANPVTAEVLKRPGAWSAFVEALKADKASNAYELKKVQDHGLAVRDERIEQEDLFTGRKSAQSRAAVDQGVEGYTIRVHLNDRVRAWASSLVFQLEQMGDGPNNPFFQTAEKLAENREAVREMWAKMTDDTTKEQFYRPLITDPRGLVPMPTRPDGVQNTVPVEEAIAAWDSNGGDLLSFADYIFGRHGDNTNEGANAYAAKLFAWANKYNKILEKQVAEDGSNSGAKMKGTAHVAMDARTTEMLPQEWVTFVTFGEQDMRETTHQVAVNASFGRDMADLNAVYTQMKAELEAKAGWLKTERKDRALQKKEDRARFEESLAAEEALTKLSSITQVTNNILNPQTGATGDHGVLMELLSTMVTGLLLGPKSALRNFTSLTDTMLLERSASMKSMQTALRAHGYALLNFGAGLAQIVGLDPRKDSLAIKRFNAAGILVDPGSFATLKDHLTGTYGRGLRYEKTGWTQTQRRMVQMRNLIVQARLGASRGASTPAIRAVNWFQYSQLVSNMAVVEAVMARYDELAHSAANFYAANPDHTGELTAKDIGYPDAVGFKALKEEALTHGFSLEDIGVAAYKARDTGVDYMTPDVTQKIWSIGVGRVSGESGFNNRPLWSQQSLFARATSLLVGWSFFKTGAINRVMQDPQGNRNLATTLNAMKVLGLGLLPAGMAFSLLLDEYDEKITGKRSNLRPLDVTDWHSITERAMAVGTFGFFGDVVDIATNTAQGTSGRNTFSVDGRVVWLGAVIGLLRSTRDIFAMGPENLNYANFGRQVAQSMGAGGVLQLMQAGNHVLGLDELPVAGSVFKLESRVAARTNINNYIRAAGREVGMEVRGMGGGDYIPTPVTPWVTNMLLAALQDDRAGFQKAYQGAIAAAQKRGEPDPYDYVKRNFERRHPLKSVFNTAPSYPEVQRMLQSMPENGRTAVVESVNLVNRYGAGLGLTPFNGSVRLSDKQRIRLSTPAQEGTLDRLRSRLARQD